MLKNLRLNIAALAIASFALLGGFVSASVQAGSLLDFAENKLVDALLRGQSIGTPATWYVGLTTDTCTDTGNGTEPAGNNYARVAVTAVGSIPSPTSRTLLPW